MKGNVCLIPARVRQPLEKHVPVEIWRHIFKYLYPSQLSRISMVNKNFCAIVSSLELWSHIFAIAYGPKAQLRTHAGCPRSKSYMMYICSSSLHVCERCFRRTGYNYSKYTMPLPIPVLLPRRSTDTLKHLGERFDPSFTVRMCLSCRQDHLSTYEEPLPRYAENCKINGKQIRLRYPCWRIVPDLNDYAQGSTLIDEATIIDAARRHLGGDIGIEAFDEATDAYDEKTEARIRWYQLQD